MSETAADGEGVDSGGGLQWYGAVLVVAKKNIFFFLPLCASADDERHANDNDAKLWWVQSPAAEDGHQ